MAARTSERSREGTPRGKVSVRTTERIVHDVSTHREHFSSRLKHQPIHGASVFKRHSAASWALLNLMVRELMGVTLALRSLIGRPFASRSNPNIWNRMGAR